VIVVGHTECGGAKHCVKASRDPKPAQPPKEPLLRWLERLTELARSLNLGQLPMEQALPILVKENVLQQVRTLNGMKVVQDSKVKVHGWIYDLSTGHLDDSPFGPAADH
jgi:carbonic anhydrase